MSATIYLYNIEEVFKAIKSPKETQLRETVDCFARLITKEPFFKAHQQLHIFISPLVTDFVKDREIEGYPYNPFKIPVEGKEYEEDVILGVMWCTGPDDAQVMQFPYSICFTDYCVALCSGPSTDIEVATTLVNDLLAKGLDYVMTMSGQMDLLERFIKKLLPASSKTVL